MRLLTIVASLAALALSGPACQSSPTAALPEENVPMETTPTPAAAAPQDAGLEGPTWRLRALGDRDEQALAAAERGFSARFERGRVEGSSGCNRYTGSYTRDGERITLGPFAGTRMACPEPVMALEQAFLAALTGTLRLAITGGRLILTPGSGGPLVFEAEPAPTLEAVDWHVTLYNNGEQAVVSVLAGTDLTLRFEGGAVSGASGCNTFRAAYTASGDELTVSTAATTRKMCGDARVMEQEQRFLAALQSSGRWTVRDERLELRQKDGALLVSARRAAAP